MTLISISEAARILGVSPRVVITWRARQKAGTAGPAASLLPPAVTEGVSLDRDAIERLAELRAKSPSLSNAGRPKTRG